MGNLSQDRRLLAYHVDPRGGHCGIDDDALTALRRSDEKLGLLVLLGDKWRDIGLESSSSAVTMSA